MNISLPVWATRVLLNVLSENGQPVDTDAGSKAVFCLQCQPGVIRAELSPSGNLELHYDADQVTLVELGRSLQLSNLRVGFA